MATANTISQQIWEMANTLRGKIGAEAYRSYILGFIFYRYLSEHQTQYFIDNHLFDLQEGQTVAQAYQAAAEVDGLDPYLEDLSNLLGYAIKPEHLWEVKLLQNAALVNLLIIGNHVPYKIYI